MKQLGKMTYRELVLSFCDEQMGLKCMETFALASKDIYFRDEEMSSYEKTYLILKNIASGNISSAHFPKSEARRVLLLIDKYSH